MIDFGKNTSKKSKQKNIEVLNTLAEQTSFDEVNAKNVEEIVERNSSGFFNVELKQLMSKEETKLLVVVISKRS